MGDDDRDTALDRIREGVVILDGGTVAECNPAARRLLEADDGLEGTPVAALPGPLREVVAEARAEAAAPADSAAPARSRISVGDGRRQLEATVHALADADTARTLVVLDDVTEHRRLERRLDSLVGNVSDVITVLDEEARVTYQSPSVERILGYDPEERLGERALEWVHQDDRERASRAFRRCVEDPEHIPNVEYRFRHADGSWVWIEARARNLLDDPAVEGVVVVSRDVTERKAREEALRRQNERLEEFASVVSHDLRNPLSTIQGRLELARETGDVEHFEPMAHAVDRMDALIDDLLALARAGGEIGEPTAVPLGELARAAWRTVDATDASLAVDDEVVVLADRARLRQLVENLLANAVEHAGPAVTVRVGGTAGGFYVEDDGPGIPAAERGVVFTRGTSGSPDGTGFGLAIVEEIAAAHGWTVDVSTGSEGGARFEFSGVDVAVDDGGSTA